MVNLYIEDIETWGDCGGKLDDGVNCPMNCLKVEGVREDVDEDVFEMGLGDGKLSGVVEAYAWIGDDTRWDCVAMLNTEVGNACND